MPDYEFPLDNYNVASRSVADVVHELDYVMKYFPRAQEGLEALCRSEKSADEVPFWESRLRTHIIKMEHIVEEVGVLREKLAGLRGEMLEARSKYLARL